MPDLDALDQTEAGFIAEQYGGTTTDQSMLSSFDFNKDGQVNSVDIASAPNEMKQGTADAVLGGGATLTTSFADSLSGQKAGQALSSTLGNVQQAAGKFGAQARQIYGGSGASMRGQISGGKAIGREFEQAHDAYGLSKQEAGLKSREGMYGLQKDRFDETEFRDFLKNFTEG